MCLSCDTTQPVHAKGLCTYCYTVERRKRLRRTCPVCNTVKTLYAHGWCKGCYDATRVYNTCNKCGKPRSRDSRALCRDCYFSCFKVVVVDCKLTHIQRRLMDILKAAPAHGILAERVIDQLYEDDPEGGPLDPKRAAYELRNRLNKRLRPYGMRIVGSSHGSTVENFLRLEHIR